MEMQNSRRPFDRSRVEPGLKKPRLAEDPSTDRASNGGSSIQPRLLASGSAASRFRAGERGGGDSESSDSVRGSYPQLQQQPNHQELVSQYKTALAELTINSKPIITNLTIIAGESMAAAKAIAATICANILEVPSDQKLPSLYLLDSIVKNIGRDYIKYFAIRLPEVFCKVYRQVDPSIHSSMRHLFGTWKGVFPPLTLQLIEKELGLTVVNGSSSGTTRSEPQNSRPGRSIHVNPKYLEARQSLQQPPRAKGTAGGISTSLVSSPEDVDRLERRSSVSSGPGKSWVDPPIKNINHLQKSQLNEPVTEKALNAEKTVNVAYADSTYGSEMSRRPILLAERTSEKYKKQGFDKPWYDSESSAAGLISGERNGYDLKHGFQNYPSHKSASAEVYLHAAQDSTNRISPGLNGSWKNSDEEEYAWDDMHPRLPNHAIAKNTVKDHWANDDVERTDLQTQLRRFQSKRDAGVSGFHPDASTVSSMRNERQATFGGEGSPLWPREVQASDTVTAPELASRGFLRHSEGYDNSFSGRFPNAATSISQTRFGLSSLNALPPLEKESRGPASPSAQSPMDQLPPSPPNDQASFNIAEQDHADSRTSQFSRRSSLDPRQRLYQDNSTTQQTLPNNAHFVGNSHRTNSSSGLSYPSPSITSSQGRSFAPFPKHPEPKAKVAEYLDQGRELPISQIPGVTELSSLHARSSPGLSSARSAESPLQATTSSLLAAVMSSGILGTTNPSLITDNLPRLNSGDAAGPLSSQSGSHPLLPTLNPVSTKSNQPLEGSESVRTAGSLGGHMESPSLAPGRIPSGSSPVSSLLSTLVEKGLITASKEKSPASKTLSQSPTVNTTSGPASAFPFSKGNSSLSKKHDQVLAKPAAKTSDALRQPIARDKKSLIGLMFKPDVIRQPHPTVIDDLLDDLPHQCHVCGLKLKLEEQLNKHLNWHETRSPDVEMLNKASRKWFVNSTEWDVGNTSSLMGCPAKNLECNEVDMVPADESQCLCILCGQLFEDVFCEEKAQWMFKGAVYAISQYLGNQTSRTEPSPAPQGPIVHKNCITETSLHDLGLAEDIKQED